MIVAEGTAAISKLPVLSEKPEADGCLDGEWGVELRTAEPALNTLAQPGWNVNAPYGSIYPRLEKKNVWACGNKAVRRRA